MAHIYQPPSPSSSDDNLSVSSVGLARQRSESAGFPVAKRTRPSQHQSVNEWAASLGQAELSGLTVDSPAQTETVGSSLPTPTSTPPYLATAPAASNSSVRADESALRTVTVGEPLARAENHKTQGAFGPAPAEAAKQQHVRPVEEADKDRFVAGLVGASCLAVQSLWGPTDRTDGSATGSGVLPIQFFVKEVLRRSRTSCSTLQLALYYLHKSRRQIREVVAKADASRAAYLEAERQYKTAYPSPPLGPADAPVADVGAKFAALLATQNSPIPCGRRMFLASLIAASKYLQDRNYSNRAWARISGLPVHEININERIFLGMMGFQLHLKADDFARWAARLDELTPHPAAKAEPVGLSTRSILTRSAPVPAPADASLEVHISPPLVAAPASCQIALGRLRHHSSRVASSSGSLVVPGAPQLERFLSPADSIASTETASSYAASTSDAASDATSPASSVSSGPRKICRMPARAFKAPETASKEQLANTRWISGPQNWSTFGWQAGAAH